MRTMRSRRGFTLVELLIVVVILGILASVVIPMFADASNDARQSTMDSNLATIRAQLELYRIQHNDAYPAAADICDDGAGADCGTDKNLLLVKTNSDGSTGGTPNLGPYLVSMPPNPFATGTVVDVTNTAAAAAKDWKYDGSGPNGFTANHQ